MMKGHGLLMTALALALFSCEHEEGAEALLLESASELTYDSRQAADTVRYANANDVEATTDCDWITLCKASGGKLPIYVQQNDTEGPRKGVVVLTSSGGGCVVVEVTQQARTDTDMNHDGSLEAYIDLPRTFALGWGYDYSVDHADIAGVRGQVFDCAALRNDFGDEVVEVENYASTMMEYVSEHSVEELQESMSAKVTGEVNLYVASASVSVEFAKQIEERKERLFIWCRDARTVKMAHFSNDVDIFDEEVVRWNTTSAFRNSVAADSPREFVKKFGTHVVVNAVLGGKLDYYFTVSSSVRTETESIVTTVNARVLFWNTSSTHVDEKTWQEVKKDFIGSFKVAGGGESGRRLNDEFRRYASKGEPIRNAGLYDAWYDCFRYPSRVNPSDLTMVDFEVIPIWEIVEVLDGAKAAEIESYVRRNVLTRIKRD